MDADAVLVESLTRDLAEATNERDALRRQVHRLVCGEEIESDLLCEDALAAQATIDRLREALAPLAEIDTSGIEWSGGECMVLVTAEDVERARAALRGGK